MGVFVNADSPKVDVDNLKDYRMGAVKEYYSEYVVRDEIKATRFEIFDTYEEMLLALKEQRIDAFIETPFTNDERHVRRINKISTYENT